MDAKEMNGLLHWLYPQERQRPSQPTLPWTYTDTPVSPGWNRQGSTEPQVRNSMNIPAWQVENSPLVQNRGLAGMLGYDIGKLNPNEQEQFRIMVNRMPRHILMQLLQNDMDKTLNESLMNHAIRNNGQQMQELQQNDPFSKNYDRVPTGRFGRYM